MRHAFVVHLDIGSDTDLLSISTEISEELFASGFTVIEVRPWSPHESSSNPLMGIPPVQPPQGGILPT